ncbi:hypothetical protein RFI_10833 [Reticulomyxa filosa]|uniref:Uncharacterized protein n=1 Tax=Reticulomyxa filosa TaxID=46433 RepID=X6NK73_RETFI|nr:hypothetical protein RFI_10833 [Reticulomyxa filosa]|eukprot:ETO26308.1 hypothetical protein RFI_10833 [Reticulomyxa filosa]
MANNSEQTNAQSHQNAMLEQGQETEVNGMLDTPNSAMISPCYGDVSSLINAVQTRRSSMPIRSPLSVRSQHVLEVESRIESLKQEFEKSKLDITSYQHQLNENKKETKTLQEQLEEAQIQHRNALREQEILMQVVGLYEMITATKIKCIDDPILQDAPTSERVDTSGNGASGHCSPQTNLSNDKNINEKENSDPEQSTKENPNSESAVNDCIEHRAVRFECKSLNPQTNSMLTFILSTYINFVDYNLISAHNFDSLPEFLASEMSFYDSSAPLFIKELLDVLFGKNKIVPLDSDMTRSFLSTNRPPSKQTSFTNASTNNTVDLLTISN